MAVNTWDEAERHLSKEPVLGEVVKRYGACTLRPKSDYFVVLCDSIISQQISVKAAEAIYNRFV
ncbi:MAG TPA: DNA-3-methyladenine glycosylase 2 family protein, partial [Verrucomicrobiae bacterium]|nr:DNA-3-methyladenine glycosylase 2 family protein [Verrucomicrobiae bacterium]